MDAFLILGQIPGTDYQLTFSDIVTVCAVTAILCLVFAQYRGIRARLTASKETPLKSNLS